MASVYEIITERFLKVLDEGKLPWEKPWVGKDDMPVNIARYWTSYKKSLKQIGNREGDVAELRRQAHEDALWDARYRGVNLFLLGMSEFSSSPYWITGKQVADLGGNVKEGQGKLWTMCVFFKMQIKEDKDGKEKAVPMWRYYRVYNIDQVEGIAKPEFTSAPDRQVETIEACIEWLSAIQPKPDIRHSDWGKAFYRPSEDFVHMPHQIQFKDDSNYWSVLAHELVHWTGHQTRLARKFGPRFGDELYSEEELTAEMGASMLASMLGFETTGTIDNSRAYVQGWARFLKDSPKAILNAGSRAQKAVDYLMNVKVSYTEAE